MEKDQFKAKFARLKEMFGVVYVDCGNGIVMLIDDYKFPIGDLNKVMAYRNELYIGEFPIELVKVLL